MARRRERRRIHALGPGERSCEQQEGCRVLFLMQWATEVHTGCRFLCLCWLCVLLIPAVEAHEGQLMGWCECGSAQMWLALLGPEILCVDVSLHEEWNYPWLLTLPSLEKGGFFLQLESFHSVFHR